MALLTWSRQRTSYSLLPLPEGELAAAEEVQLALLTWLGLGLVLGLGSGLGLGLGLGFGLGFGLGLGLPRSVEMTWGRCRSQ